MRLPDVHYIDPGWLDDSEPLEGEGRSVICRFDVVPREQGNPSIATVRFLVEAAPHQ